MAQIQKLVDLLGDPDPQKAQRARSATLQKIKIDIAAILWACAG